MDIITKVLLKERDKARVMVEAIIDSELNYLFTNDMDYKNNKTSILLKDDPNQSSHQSQNVFVQQLRDRIDSYFALVLRNVKDSIPKAVGFFLVRKSQDRLQMELYNAVNSNKGLSNILGEPASITEKREFLTQRLKMLKNAMKVL